MDGQQNQSAGFSKSGKFLSLLRRDRQNQTRGKNAVQAKLFIQGGAGRGDTTRHDTTRQRSG